MPRITISIPTDLKRRLDDPLVKKSLNISRVCQEALARIVRRILDLPIDVRRMEFLLNRLRSDREERSGRWFGEGTRIARDWAEADASYAVLERLGTAPLTRRLELLAEDPPDALEAALVRHRPDPDFHEPSFLEGWATLVGLFWEVLKRNL
jgi:hypothetical protein